MTIDNSSSSTAKRTTTAAATTIKAAVAATAAASFVICELYGYFMGVRTWANTCIRNYLLVNDEVLVTGANSTRSWLMQN